MNMQEANKSRNERMSDGNEKKKEKRNIYMCERGRKKDLATN